MASATASKLSAAAAMTARKEAAAAKLAATQESQVGFLNQETSLE